MGDGSLHDQLPGTALLRSRTYPFYISVQHTANAMPNAQPHIYPSLRILSSLNPNDDNPKPKTRPRTPAFSSFLFKPHLSIPAALKNMPSMPFGLGKRVRTDGCERERGQGSTPSTSSLESSRPSSSSVSRSESEYGTSSMSEYTQTSIESLHSLATNPLVVPPLGTKILERFWPEDEPTTDDGELAVREESAGRWASYDGMGYFAGTAEKEIAPPFLMLSPPPSRRVSRMQLPVEVSNTPSSDEFPRQNIDFTVESQLRFPF